MARWTGVPCIVIAAGLLGALAAEWAVARHDLGRKRVPGLGNFEENVALIAPPREGRFRFAVIGDPKEGRTIYRELMEAAYDMGAELVVSNGDLVDQPTPESFELFNQGYESLGNKALPTFIAIGNHDESGDCLFQDYYGPEQFTFLHGDSLFIFADNNRRDRREECGRYVREQIRRFREAARHVFVVLHHPISDCEKDGRTIRNCERSAYLTDVLASEHVDAVLTGHFHGYAREVRDGTLILVTGGGGARLHDAHAFYHMVLIDVGPDGIEDSLVRLDEAYPFTDRVRVEAVVRYPLFFGAWWRPILFVLPSLALSLLGVRLLHGRSRKPLPRGSV